MSETLIPIMPFLGGFGLIIALITFISLKRYAPGNEKMVDIADKIHMGAMVFLKREYTIIAIFMVIIFAALSWTLSIWTGVAYLTGAISSMLCGYFGMEAATMSSSRTCQGAKDGQTPRALAIAFQGGSVMGLCVAAMGVLGLSI